MHLYQRVQSHQVPVEKESFTHRNYLLEGRSRVWLWHFKGTQADTAKIYFYRLPSWHWARGEWKEMEQDHTSFCPALLPSHRGIWDLFLFCLFAQWKPKLKGKLKAYCSSSSTIVNTSLLYIKKTGIYLAKISPSQRLLFNIRTTSIVRILTKC